MSFSSLPNAPGAPSGQSVMGSLTSARARIEKRKASVKRVFMVPSGAELAFSTCRLSWNIPRLADDKSAIRQTANLHCVPSRSRSLVPVRSAAHQVFQIFGSKPAGPTVVPRLPASTIQPFNDLTIYRFSDFGDCCSAASDFSSPPSSALSQTKRAGPKQIATPMGMAITPQMDKSPFKRDKRLSDIARRELRWTGRM